MTLIEKPLPAGSQTLARGLRVLRVLSSYPDGLSVSQIAAELGTHRAGIYRLLGPLVDQRLVARDEAGNYTLGLGLIELGSKVRPLLRERALDEMRVLADEIGATVALTMRDGEEAIVAAVVEPRSTDLHVTYRPGLRHKLDQAASGIALLAALPPREGEREAIVQARERGWSRSFGELLAGCTGVGAPIVVPGHEPQASISAVWIAQRDDESMGLKVAEAAAKIASSLR